MPINIYFLYQLQDFSNVIKKKMHNALNFVNVNLQNYDWRTQREVLGVKMTNKKWFFNQKCKKNLAAALLLHKILKSDTIFLLKRIKSSYNSKFYIQNFPNK